MQCFFSISGPCYSLFSSIKSTKSSYLAVIYVIYNHSAELYRKCIFLLTYFSRILIVFLESSDSKEELTLLTIVVFIVIFSLEDSWDNVQLVKDLFSRFEQSSLSQSIDDKQPVSLRSTCIVHVHHQERLANIVIWIAKKKIGKEKIKKSNLSSTRNLAILSQHDKECSKVIVEWWYAVSVFIYLFISLEMLDRRWVSYLIF